MQAFINHSTYREDEIRFMEIDFSKFDKSQDEFAMHIQSEIMRLFGVDEEFIKYWERTHNITNLRFREYGFKTTVAY